MAISSEYLFLASMDVDADREALFNEVYDREHVPLLSEVPGVLAVTRFVRQPLTLSIGGERRTVDTAQEPLYTTLYELEGPEVLTGEPWAKAIERGRWPEQVRPYTRNRRHVLMKLIPPGRGP